MGHRTTDSNKANPVYLSAVPANVTTSAWLNQQATYTVPVGKAFLGFIARSLAIRCRRRRTLMTPCCSARLPAVDLLTPEAPHQR